MPFPLQTSCKANQIKDEDADNTCKHGSKCIDAVMRTYSIIECIAGCQRTECDKIIMNDYREYLIGTEIERYYNYQMLLRNKPNHRVINHTKKSHTNAFNSKIDELLDSVQPYKRVLELTHANSNAVDNIFAEILTKDRAVAKELRRAFPFSQKKLKINNSYLFWKVKIKNMQEQDKH